MDHLESDVVLTWAKVEIKGKELYFSVKFTILMETFLQSCVRLNIDPNVMFWNLQRMIQTITSYVD